MMRSSSSSADLHKQKNDGGGGGSPLLTSPVRYNSSNSNLNALLTTTTTTTATSLASSRSFGSSSSLSQSHNEQQTAAATAAQQELLSMIPQYLIKQYETDVRCLFEKNAPEQMKTIENTKRSEIEDMKSQLRYLIGNKYRDLVQGSDAIVKMKSSTQQITENVIQMQKDLKSFSEKRLNNQKSPLLKNKNQNPIKSQENQKKVALFAKNCKFLIDVPEIIWRSLDNKDFFEVSAQYLKSKYLYKLIHIDQNLEIKSIMSKLPIIEKDWIKIEQQIPNKAVSLSFEYLEKNQNLPIEKYIGCLSSLILFEKKSIKEILDQFLSSRRTLLFTEIISKGLSLQSPPSIHVTIEKMIQFLKSTIYYILVLFYPRPSSSSSTTPNTNTSSSNIDQDDDEEDNSINISSTYQSKLSKYKSTFSTNRNSTEQNTATTSSTEIKELSEKELNMLSVFTFTSSTLEHTFSWKSPFLKESLLFFKDISSGSYSTSQWNKDLDTTSPTSTMEDDEVNNINKSKIKLEDTIDIEHSLIEIDMFSSKVIIKKTGDWVDEILNDFQSLSLEFFKGINSIKDLSALRLEIINYLLQFEQSIFSNNIKDISNSSSNSNSLTLNWNRLFKVITGKDNNNIINIFDKIFLNKAQGIIEQSFSSINLTSISNELLGRLEDKDKDFSQYLWSFNENDPIETIKNKTNGITPLIDLFFNKITSLYSNCKKDVLYLLSNNISVHHPIDQNLVYEFMIKSFTLSISQFNANNQKKIDQFIKENQHAKNMDEILFISKLSKLFYQHIILNPDLYFFNFNNNSKSTTSASLQSFKNTLSSPSSSSPTTIVQSPMIDDLKQQFYYGSIIWIENFVKQSSKSLYEMLIQEKWSDPNRTSSWEKMTIDIETESGTKQSVIYIPFQPSSYIISFLLSISFELGKFSLNTLDKNILRYTIECINQNISNIIERFLLSTNNNSNGNNSTKDLNGDESKLSQDGLVQAKEIKLSKEGYLQMLIDLRYVGFLLYGKDLGSNKSSTTIKDPIFKKALSHFNSQKDNVTKLIQFNSTIEMISSKMDPIDLAFYEPYIQKFIESSFIKTSTLFGNFTYLHKSIVKPEKKSNITEIPNIIPLINTNTKFQLFSLENISTNENSNSTQQSPTNIRSAIDSKKPSASQPINVPPNTRSTSSSTSTGLSPNNTSSININTFSMMGKKISDLMYNKK
ncbi:hypothetical protein CYY_002709 [Polysphondylium violaceum]|uniref:Conserved oligomeric Golgi complex subunit 1 n=1 Tax=Polysphondylium violaceum TaxID=133409 RepID=A0A8J4Q0U2_9MYCE|nr:hypothetical protein CYY_002709 [Polysphondylium violaceum]